MSILEIPVTGSSNIEHAAYYTDTKEFEVEFVQGRIYRYENVPADVVQDFILAESKGRFLNLSIKGQYDYYELDFSEE